MLLPPDAVLQAQQLVHTFGERGTRSFVLDVPELTLWPGRVLALCGASGSGKSTLLAILAGRLRPDRGRVVLATSKGPADLGCLQGASRREVLSQIGFVDQDPMSSLNDRRRVVDIVADPLVIHGQGTGPPGGSRARRLACQRDRALGLLERVGIDRRQAERGPGTLSGGQRQRVAVARALVCQPRILFLDEPTSALDVSVQAALVELLRTLHATDQDRTAFVLVTHDLALARQLADHVGILENGRLVEYGPADRVLDHPQTPSAQRMLAIASEETAWLGG